MSALKKSLLLLTATALSSFATSITFTSTQVPTSISGGALGFEVYSATLTQPTSPGGPWELQIEMNYDGTVTSSSFNPFVFNAFTYSPGDFLIEQDVNDVITDYGIVMSDHPDALTGMPDSNYVAGNLYAVGGTLSFQFGQGFVTSGPTLGNNAGSILPFGVSPDPSFPTWLAPGGTEAGAGTLSIVKTGNGTTSPMYTVTDFFDAPTTFLPSDATFTIDMTSAICANGTLTGTGPFPPPPSVPEPGTLTLMSSALLLLGFARFRKRAN